MSALENKPLPVFGDGTQTRSFCYVDDLIEGVVSAMNSQDTKGEVFNLGNPDEFSVLELAEKVKQLTKSDSEIVHEGLLPQDDPQRRCPDISKAKRVLGWEPKFGLDEGLAKLIKFLS